MSGAMLGDIIRRLEAGESGRGVDQDIFHALGLCAKSEDGTCADYRAPLYTTSLDAALTLVPEGYIWDVASTGVAWVEPGDDYINPDIPHFSGNAPTPALALCIAALKARAAQ